MARRQLGVLIRRQREAKGWSQQKLADEAKVSQPYLSQLEAGTYKNPGIAVLRKLAKALGVPVTELLE
jgi:XRE family transcriptional regulator, regulator of sulfur utilization